MRAATGYEVSPRALVPGAAGVWAAARGSSGVRAVGRIAWVLGFAAALCGCSSVQPWVKPYEREHLAEPIMSFDRNPLPTAFMEHVYEVRSAARGATGSAGGGCGCN